MSSENGDRLPLNVLRAHLNKATHEGSVEYLYTSTHEGDRRWANLVSYLEFMKNVQPDVLLIGEAPGYRGTAISGLHFLSEGIINHPAACRGVVDS